MSASMAHARSVLVQLHPARPGSGRAWGALTMGFLGLALASRYLDHGELGDRLFAAMWLLFACAGISGLRRACWSPPSGELALLPIGRTRRLVVEGGTYLLLILTLAVPLVLVQSWLGLRWRSVLAPVPESAGVEVLQALAHLALATALLLPLLVATAPEESRQGPLAMLRLLLPWLPLGVAAPAGWLETPWGVLLTLLAMAASAALLLALRRTGWEAWWPRLPDLSRRRGQRRPGLAPPLRLATDYRDGLRHGLGWGIALLLPAWLLMAASARGIIDEDWSIAALLLMVGAFMTATQSAMSIPLAARFPIWEPEAIPWAGLPIPNGAMQQRIHSSQAIAVLVLGALHLLAMGAAYRGLPAGKPALLATDLTAVMMLPMMPVVMLWEGRFTNSPRTPSLCSRALLVTLGIASIALPVTGCIMLFEPEAWLNAGAPMSWGTAYARVGTVAGPAALVGLAWLAAGRLLVLRDIARQRQGGRT
jgi:hypothetical protein